jgi:hypothetical protein
MGPERPPQHQQPEHSPMRQTTTPPPEDISYEMEISKNTSHGTNDLAANITTIYFNTLPYRQTNEYIPQDHRGTNNAKVSANSNTNDRSNNDTPPAIMAFPLLLVLANHVRPREAGGQHLRQAIVLVLNRGNLTAGNANSLPTTAPRLETSLP